MAESDVEICNRALSAVGVSALISSLTETGSVEAEQCNLWYSRLRDQILRERVWPFATRVTALAVVAGETRSQWAFIYGLPANCLKVRGLLAPGGRDPWLFQGYPYRYFQGAAVPVGGVPPANLVVPHAIEARVDGDGNVIGKLLLCDLEDAELRYTLRVTNPQVFDPDFEEALEYLLASKLARALPKDEARAQRLEESYLRACRAAGAAAVNEEQGDPDGASSFETARR